MKEYPSIPGWREVSLGRPCIAFNKLDGSNIRAEWSPKQGWYKFGARHRMLDAQDEQLGLAVTLFERKYADVLEQQFKERVWKKLGVRNFVVFFEYVGPNSFAGYHPDEPEQMDVFLFDVNPTPKGFLPPAEFVKLFGPIVDIPGVVYEGNFNIPFIESVIRNDYNLQEGVVVKGMDGKKLWMSKVKTQQWLDRLKSEKGESEEGL